MLGADGSTFTGLRGVRESEHAPHTGAQCGQSKSTKAPERTQNSAVEASYPSAGCRMVRTGQSMEAHAQTFAWKNRDDTSYSEERNAGHGPVLRESLFSAPCCGVRC